MAEVGAAVHLHPAEEQGAAGDQAHAGQGGRREQTVAHNRSRHRLGGHSEAGFGGHSETRHHNPGVHELSDGGGPGNGNAKRKKMTY